jgi:lipoprotein signal peptidase
MRRVFAILFLLVVVDLLIKFLVIDSMSKGEMHSFMGTLITIARIETLRMAYGFSSGFNPVFYTGLLLQLSLSILFIRLQMVPVGRSLQASSLIILSGWVGNLLDMILFSEGRPGYVHLDYFSIGNFFSFTNISSLLSLGGWVLFVYAVVKDYRNLGLIFKTGKP